MPERALDPPEHDVHDAPALRALADCLPLGVLIYTEHRLEFANAEACRQLRYSPAHLAALPPARLFAAPEDADPLLRSPQPLERTVHLACADGERLHACVTSHPWPPAAGHSPRRPGGRLLVIASLAERDDVRAQLTRQREELQAMAQRLLTVQEDERASLSRELHDDIGQAITAMKLSALALREEDEQQRREAIAEIVQMADQTVGKLRDLSLLLRPPQLDALGLEAALRWQASRLFRGDGPRLELDLHPLPRRPRPDVELACFRIAQEALTNVLRHAQARHVRVHLAAADGGLRLRIEDDGAGFDPQRPSGLGLITMRERAHQLGGRLEVRSRAGAGTAIEAELPLAPSAA